MKFENKWSFSPYRPALYDVGEPYICRVAPGKNEIAFEWLGEADAEYDVFLRKLGDERYVSDKTNGTSYVFRGLMSDTDYEFYVSRGNGRSRVRLARTCEIDGTVVNYLHPNDTAYSFSGQYLCSPCVIRHPDGFLLASMDVFGAGTPQNLSLIFRSDDNGKTWHYVSELFPCFWGRMFIHRGELYMMACSTEYGDLLIGKSTDGGKTFSMPTVLLRGSCHSKVAGVHKNPQPPVIYGGRIYMTLEWGSWGEKFYHAAMVASADENADLCDSASWSFSEPVLYDPEWKGVAQGRSCGNIEGTLCVFPDGKLYNVMRYDMTKCTPSYGLVLAYKVNTKDPEAPLEYSHPIKLPGNHSKFTIRYDDVSGYYYTIICRITGVGHECDRNLVSLMRSRNAEKWETVCDLIDETDKDPKKIGFQYIDFLFDGDDLIWLCRTSYGEPHNFHDANYSVFHRTEKFRNL
ncbi:MAG: exo-alpha-sialidase [Clostridiales bacterium]|nr:exo-alpha-sialidase [Clostridiales bacterium]